MYCPECGGKTQVLRTLDSGKGYQRRLRGHADNKPVPYPGGGTCGWTIETIENAERCDWKDRLEALQMKAPELFHVLSALRYCAVELCRLAHVTDGRLIEDQPYAPFEETLQEMLRMTIFGEPQTGAARANRNHQKAGYERNNHGAETWRSEEDDWRHRDRTYQGIPE